MGKTVRKKLTDLEYNAILTLTAHTKLDHSFDAYDCGDCDKFKDRENNRLVCLTTGLEWLYDGLAYSLYYDGLNDEEAYAIVGLFKEFLHMTDEELQWLLEKEEE